MSDICIRGRSRCGGNSPTIPGRGARVARAKPGAIHELADDGVGSILGRLHDDVVSLGHGDPELIHTYG